MPFHKINKTIGIQLKTERNGDRKHSDSFSSSHYTSNESNRQLTTSFQDNPPEKLPIHQQHYMHKVVSTNPTHQPIRMVQNPNNSFELLKPPPPVSISYIKQ